MSFICSLCLIFFLIIDFLLVLFFFSLPFTHLNLATKVARFFFSSGNLEIRDMLYC